MAYVSLYRKFRPDTFDKVVGQKHIVQTLINQIKKDRIGHAYLFTGTRGTGKTSCAKIFARAVNCLSPVNGSPCGKCANCIELANPSNIDVIEMDAASNNGVDEIRQIKENVQYRPNFVKYKVYIIDEVHMLSTSAFNALLKTLEEPPEYVIFILATTEVQKIPQTILSRCMRFDFRLVPVDALVSLLARIFDEMNITYENAALETIATHGEGSVRDALSIADMCLSYCDKDITLSGVLDVLGASDFSGINELGSSIINGDTGKALTALTRLYKEGKNTLHSDLSNYFRDAITLKNVAGANVNGLNKVDAAKLKKIADNAENYRLARCLELLCSIESALRYSTQPKLLLEATVVRACELSTDLSLDGLTARVKELEEKIENGQFTVASAEITEEKAEPKKEQETVATATKIIEKLKDYEEAEDTYFDDEPEENDVAYETWRAVVNSLGDKVSSLVTLACGDFDRASLEEKKLSVYTKDELSYGMVTVGEVYDVLRECAVLILGKGATLNLVLDKESNDSKMDRIERLRKLTNNKLILK